MKGSLAAAAILTILQFNTLVSDGQEMVKETRSVRDFDRVSFGVAGSLYIMTGPEFRLEIEGDRRVVGNTEIQVRDGRLVIRNLNNNFGFRGDQKVIINLTMPAISGIAVSGSGVAEIMDAVSADGLNLGVSGSGKLKVPSVEADRLECSISGSGDIIIEGRGSVDDAEISISGSGSYTGELTEIDHLLVKVSGSGSCYCNAGDSLEASISGSGSIYYSGNPKINARVSGSGKVRSR